MRTASLVALPLQTAFARNPVSLATARGGGGALFSGFHARSGLQHPVWRRQRGVKQRHSDGIYDNSTGPRRLIVRCLNRIMLEPFEVVKSAEGGLSATLSAVDSRTVHVRGVLKAEDGESIRVGVVDAGRMDDASISWREPVESPEGAPPADIPGRDPKRKAASKWRDLVLDLGGSERLLEPVPQDQRPKVALMLAVPRPLQLERILPIVSSLGVTTLVLCQARKVPKFYFGSHLFRDTTSIREKLIEGLSQCGETVLPKVIVARRLKVFLEDDLESLFPRDRWVRAVAHPTRLPAQGERAGGEAVRGSEAGVSAEGAGDVGTTAAGAAEIPVQGLRFSELGPPKGCDPADAGVLVAVGPEGGWVEPDELEVLESFGFEAVTLGPRVLRSDVAVSALLALAHAWRDDRTAQRSSSPLPLPIARVEQ